MLFKNRELRKVLGPKREGGRQEQETAKNYTTGPPWFILDTKCCTSD
jgi:hypothetical protein